MLVPVLQIWKILWISGLPGRKIQHPFLKCPFSMSGCSWSQWWDIKTHQDPHSFHGGPHHPWTGGFFTCPRILGPRQLMSPRPWWGKFLQPRWLSDSGRCGPVHPYIDGIFMDFPLLIIPLGVPPFMETHICHCHQLLNYDLAKLAIPWSSWIPSQEAKRLDTRQHPYAMLTYADHKQKKWNADMARWAKHGECWARNCKVTRKIWQAQ